MDSFLNFFVRQKKLALVFTLGIIAVGILVLNNIQREKFPNVSFETMIVVTSYPGASPEDVEQNVTNPIEDELNNISGIDNFTSTSRTGISNIMVKLSHGVSDISELKQDIRNAVNRVKSFPIGVVVLPKVIDAKTSNKSVLRVSIGSDAISYAKLRKIVDNIANSIELLDGVSEVTKQGYLDKEIQIKINPKKLYLHKLSLPQVMRAIDKHNKRYTVGSNNNDKNEKIIVILSKFSQAKDVGEVIIKSSFTGPIIRLKEVASISEGSVKESSIVRVNGKKGFVLSINKKTQADVINTVDLIKEKMLKISTKYDKLKIFYSSDLSKSVRNRLDIVTNNGIIGLLLVLIILGLFLSFKTAFWVAASLPVSLLGSVALLGATGETLNLISLAAMILVLGLVVDDSIVVAESVHHYKQQGENKYKAAVYGFKRVIMPVITTILTTILAFSSMFLMGGTMGKFIYIIPLVAIFALSLSFLEISFALPAHLAGIKTKKKSLHWFTAVEIKFEWLLTRVLKIKYLVIVFFTLLLMGSLYFFYSQMSFVLFPTVGVDNINARLVMKQGSSLANTENKAKEIEMLINKVVNSDLVSTTSNIGKYHSHKAKFNIELTPSADRKRDSKIILEQLKTGAKKITGMEKLLFSVHRPGPKQGQDLEINLISQNNEQRKKAASELYNILRATLGVNNIERNDDPGKDRLEISLNYEKMARLEIEQDTLKQYLQSAFAGIDVSSIREGKNDVNFRVYLSDNPAQDFISSILVVNKKGKMIPISHFTSIRTIIGEPNFNHYNGLRTTMISASIDDKQANAQTVTNNAIKQLDIPINFPDVRVVNEGGVKETQESMNNFKQALLMSIFGIFLLLILLFNSYTQPLLILSTMPFAVIGVIWAFFFHDQTLSFFAILGTLALVGVIVNDTLVLVSHINYLRNKNTLNIIQCIIQGTKDRLRAVVLTSLTTLAGILPLAYGIGGIDHLLQPMALSLGYGLLFGTLMTLILLPCLYLINHRIVTWFGQKFKI